MLAMQRRAVLIVTFLHAAVCCIGKVIDFEVAGAKADDDSSDTQWANGALLNATLNALQPGDVFRIPNKTFHVVGGITVNGINSARIEIDGTLSFSDDTKHWPTKSDGSGDVLMCMTFKDIENVTFTSSGVGTLNGNGKTWWGIPGIGYLTRGENRPRLLEIDTGKSVLVERLLFLNSPYWTFWAHSMDGLEVRNCDIDARRDHQDGHSIIDLTAFNTDGYDVTGKNVWIHDCSVWNQDDCIAVKDGSENMLFERITASGVGLTIGSIGGSVVRNITFRNCSMHKPVKGIYMKVRAGDAPSLISDVLYENIVIDEPSQWPIWIGPAQQSDSSNPCAAHPCSLCWPQVPFTQCLAPASGSYVNITLRNVTVNNPKQSPGVIYANASNLMKNVVFENVVVNNPGTSPWGDDYYKCENAQGVAIGNTKPVPPCFLDRTNSTIAILA